MNTAVTESEQAERVDRDLVAAVEAHIDAHLRRSSLPANLTEAIRYAVLGGGKMLRPLLAIRSCQAVGGTMEDALGPAAALELIHAFSLVHDDLPAMDDDQMRRGRPTLHVRAGEAMAILAGDAMMSLAFELIGAASLDDERKNAITADLALGTTAMIAGQVYDTLGGFDENLSEREKLVLIHRNKTGALIRAACRVGGHCGGATSEELGRLSEFGDAVGLMFQIVDDVLDVTQTADHLGKASGKDLEAGKLTYPGVLGIEQSRGEITRLRDAALQAVKPLGESANHLAHLCRFLAVRTK